MCTQALPAWADDYTVTVHASVAPTTIYTGQSATGSATATITGNTSAATAELAQYNPSPTFSIASVSGATPPSASINADGSGLTVTAISGTPSGTYTVTVQATYAWTDVGTHYSESNTATVSVTVIAPTVTFSPGSVKLDLGAPNNLGASQVITGTITPQPTVSEINSVTLSQTQQQCVTIGAITNINATAGTFQFTITASRATNSTFSPAYSSINASIFGVICGSLRAVVLVPASLSEVQGATTVVNSSYTNTGGPDPPYGISRPAAGYLVFLTDAETLFTITIYDQFGNTLDSNWNNSPVNETAVSGGQTVGNGPIVYPTGILTNGVILDDSGRKQWGTVPIVSPTQQADWAAFNIPLPPNGWNNEIAFKFSTDPSTVTLKLTDSIAGHTLTPTETRTNTYTQVNETGSNTPTLDSTTQTP